MAIAAKISRFRTRPYEPQEIASMDPTEYERIKAWRYEKILGEEVVEEFVADDLGELRERVSSIVEAHKPNPIIVKTPGNAEDPEVKHSFLIENGFSFIEDDGILESIIFRPKDIEAYQEKRQREMQQYAGERATQAEQAEFVKKVISRVLAETVRSFPSLRDRALREFGFANNDEFKAYFAELYSKRGSFATEDQFFDFLRAEWDKRTEEAGARKRKVSAASAPSFAGHLHSIINDEMTVLCRIIGKDSALVSMYQQYYFKWNGISDNVFSVTNHAEDRLTARFVYGKDVLGGQQ